MWEGLVGWVVVVLVGVVCGFELIVGVVYDDDVVWFC